MVKDDGQPEPSYQYLSPNLMEMHQNIFNSLTSHKKCPHCCDEPEVVELFANDAGEGGSDLKIINNSLSQ